MSFEVQNAGLNQNLKITNVPESKVNQGEEVEEKNLELVEDKSEDDGNELVTVNKDIEDIGITDAAAIDYFDADGDGKVSLSEFIGGILNMFGITGEDKTEEPSTIDNDQNADEPTDVDGADETDEATEDPALEDKTAEIDTNGDGIITQEEIDAYNYKTQDRTADLDLDGDGKITQEEIDAYNTRHADDKPVEAEPSTISEEPSTEAPADEAPSTEAPADEDPSSEAPADGESDVSVLDYDGDHVVTQEEMQRYIDENGIAAFYDAFGALLGPNDIEY